MSATTHAPKVRYLKGADLTVGRCACDRYEVTAPGKGTKAERQVLRNLQLHLKHHGVAE